MREILFRGLTPKGQWVYGCYIKNGYDLFERLLEHSIAPEKQNPLEVVGSTIGQFTGLHDRDGKRIFEGDVLKHPHASAPEDVGWIVSYSEFYGWKATLNGLVNGDTCTTKLSDYFRDTTIIGNIHEL